MWARPPAEVFKATSLVSFKFCWDPSFIALTFSSSLPNSIIFFCASVNLIPDFSKTPNWPLRALAIILALSASCSPLADTPNWFTAKSASDPPSPRTALLDKPNVESWAKPSFMLSPSRTPFFSSSLARFSVSRNCSFVALVTPITACSNAADDNCASLYASNDCLPNRTTPAVKTPVKIADFLPKSAIPSPIFFYTFFKIRKIKF